MKRISIALLFTATLFLSCNKEKEASFTSVLSCTIDGVDHTFESDTNGWWEFSSGIMAFGYKYPTGTNQQMLILNMNANREVLKGNYFSNPDPTVTTQQGRIILREDMAVSKQYITPINTPNHVVITITDLGKDFVRGTFQGKLVAHENNSTNDNDFKQVTNGKFHIRFHE